jgi:hypothetical protein
MGERITRRSDQACSGAIGIDRGTDKPGSSALSQSDVPAVTVMPSAAGFPSLPRRGQGRFISRTNLSLTLLRKEREPDGNCALFGRRQDRPVRKLGHYRIFSTRDLRGLRPA